MFQNFAKEVLHSEQTSKKTYRKEEKKGIGTSNDPCLSFQGFIDNLVANREEWGGRGMRDQATSLLFQKALPLRNKTK